MADLKVNNITNYDGTTGPVIAGVSTVLSTSHFVVPVGNTFKRSVTENIVNDGLVLYLDAGNDVSYDAYENLINYSEQFDNASWNKTNASATPNATVAPDGTLTADTITATANDDVIISQIYTASYNSTPLTYSIFAKAGTYRYIAIQSFVNVWSKTLVFDLQTGTALTPFYPNDGRTWNIVAYPNGWYRCIVTYPANYYYYYYFQFGLTNYVGPSDGGISSATSPAVGEYIYVWGAQLERGSTVGSYYPTTGASKTRGTTWTDLSGNNNTGTLVNGPTYSSANGGSLVFDGADDYVQISNNVSPGTGDFAISVWVYKTETVTNRYIWDFGANGGTLSSGTSITQGFRYYNPTLGASVLYNSGPVHNINTWYNIVISRISGTTYFYSNGSLINSAADAGNIGSWGTTLYIGRYGGSGGYEHQGSISNVMIYKNKGLTATEVLQNFNATRSRYGI